VSAPLALARRLGLRSRGVASPNPWVGALVVDASGVLVGRGRTQRPGAAHAEVVALEEAGERARGATMVVTLEPCAHHGRTPPCVDAIVAAGIREVQVGLVDPDPRVAGRGLAALEAAGVRVVLAPRPEVEPIVAELAPYLSHRLRQRPWVIGKVAMTLDAAVADREGRSRWITGEAARDLGHRVRAWVDAIVVGRRTFEQDAPQLTARPGGRVARHQPARLVASRHPLELPEGYERVGGDPAVLVRELGERGWLSLLVEGGPTLFGAFLDAGLVDEVLVAIAPLVLGDPEAQHAWRLAEPRLLGAALEGSWRTLGRRGKDQVAWLSLPSARELAEAYWAFEARVLAERARR